MRWFHSSSWILNGSTNEIITSAMSNSQTVCIVFRCDMRSVNISTRLGQLNTSCDALSRWLGMDWVSDFSRFLTTIAITQCKNIDIVWNRITYSLNLCDDGSDRLTDVKYLSTRGHNINVIEISSFTRIVWFDSSVWSVQCSQLLSVFFANSWHFQHSLELIFDQYA